MVDIKILQLANVDAYREIRLSALRTWPDLYGQTVEEAQVLDFEAECTPEPEKFILGAFEGRFLVGITAFRRQTRTKLRHRGDIIQVYVRPEFTRQQIARMLITRAVTEAFALEGLEFVELGVRPFNAPAVALYESLGFEKIVLWPDYFRDGGKEGGQLYMRLSREAWNRRL